VLNSVVFLISISMTVATFLANYRGKPFMQSLSENKPLLYTLVATEAFLLLCAMELLDADITVRLRDYTRSRKCEADTAQYLLPQTKTLCSTQTQTGI
jgi:magnesium-transporting ATPase (P-type)